MDPLLVKLYFEGTISNFVYRYYMQHLDFFSKLQTPPDLEAKFIPGEKEWNALVSYAKKDKIDLERISSKGKEDVLKRIKVMMARQIWRTEGYYEVNNLSDQTVKEALKILK